MLPLYFTPDPKTPLRSLAVEIDYVSNNLKFQGAPKGTVADTAEIDVSATLTDGQPDAKGITRSTLRVAASLGGANPKDGIPAGLLAYLLFQVSTEAKPFAIRLNTTVVSAEDLQGGKVAKVSAQSGMIIVETYEAIPEATCFFFTH